MIGKNLAIENSFYIQLINQSQFDYTVNLFNSGASPIGGNTVFVNSNLWILNALATTTVKFSVFQSATTVIIRDDASNIISSVNMSAGQTIDQYLAAANPITDLAGNQGLIFIEEVGPQSYNIRITRLPTVSTIQFTPDAAAVSSPVVTTYASLYPWVLASGTIPLQQIQASETGNSYAIMGLDLYSTDQLQLLQPVIYGRRSANGNYVQYVADPVIDPYQYNHASIHSLDMGAMIIDVEATFSYKVHSTTSVRLTFNYIKASTSMAHEFVDAFSLELLLKFLTEKQYLDQSALEKQILIQ